MIVGLNFSKNELIYVCFSSEIKEFCSILYIFDKTWLYLVLHDFNLTYYSSIILGSFSILLFPKLCWHIGLTLMIVNLFHKNVSTYPQYSRMSFLVILTSFQSIYISKVSYTNNSSIVYKNLCYNIPYTQ